VLFGGAQDETVDVVDDTADVERDASGGVRYIRRPLEDDDLHIRGTTAGLSGGAHARRISPYDDEFSSCHEPSYSKVAPGAADESGPSAGRVVSAGCPANVVTTDISGGASRCFFIAHGLTVRTTALRYFSGNPGGR